MYLEILWRGCNVARQVLHSYYALIHWFDNSGIARSPNLVILPLMELALHAKPLPQRLGYCAKPNLSPGRVAAW